jgi:zinc protease
MNRFGVAVLACAALFLGAARSAPAAPAPTVVTLRNGLRVLLAPDSSATAVDVGVWYPAGTRWESPGMSGVSHLSTRLMFRGSAHAPDGAHLGRLLAEGGAVNVTNTPDGTCYWETLPAEALALALGLEADRMAGLATTPAAFEGARTDARADRRARGGATPIARGLARLVATAFPQGGYGRPLYGEDADLKRMAPRAVEDWRRAHYGAGSAVLTIAGRFEPVATLAYVRGLFESLPRGAAPAAPREAAPAAGERRGWARGQTPLRIAFAGWRGPGAADPDAPAIEVMAAVLGAQGSRLQEQLIGQWKVAVVTQARAEMNRDASLLWVAAALGAEADSSTAERVLLDEVGRLAREPLGDAELGRARARIVTDALFASQPVRGRAAALGEALFETGDATAADRRLAAIERVTAADVQRVAQGIVTDAGRSVFWYVPAGEGR